MLSFGSYFDGSSKMLFTMSKPTWVDRHALSIVVIFAYLLMSLLVIEQSRIIDSQRKLIRQLFSDSLELNAAKIREFKTHRR